MAYELIETIEVGSGGAASIEFTSIPQDGTDLLCVLSTRSSSTDEQIKITVNANAVHTAIRLEGDGSTAASFSMTNIRALGGDSGFTSDTFGNSQVYFSNYTAASSHSVSVDAVFENNATYAEQWLVAGNDGESTAISSLTFEPSGAGNFDQYSTASLYKIY